MTSSELLLSVFANLEGLYPAGVWLLDLQGKVIAGTPHAEPDSRLSGAIVDSLNGPTTGTAGREPYQVDSYLLLPVNVSGETVAYLAARRPASGPGGLLTLRTVLETLMERQAAALRAVTRLEAERTLARELVQESASFKEEALLRQATQLGYNMTYTRVPILARLSQRVNEYFHNTLNLGYGQYLDQARETLLRTVKESRYVTSQDLVVFLNETSLLILKAFPTQSSARKIYLAADAIAQDISDRLQALSVFDVTLTYGSVCRKIKDYFGAYSQAKENLALGQIFFPDRTGFLSTEQLLFPFIVYHLPEQVITKDIQGILTKLRTADEQLAVDLIRTAEVYLDSQMSIQRTAESLYLHRNTVAFRLGKLKSLTGLELDKDFWAALLLKLTAVYLRIIVHDAQSEGKSSAKVGVEPKGDHTAFV